MSEDCTPSYLKPYEDAIEEHGGTFEATLWRSREGQSLRFTAFTNKIDFTGTIIIDVGCGVGDFATFLSDTNIQYDSFHGIDAMETMIETANQRQLQRCTFETADIMTKPELMQGADWCVFSGTLNAMSQQDAMAIIEQAFKACSIGVAFNFLSNQSWRDPSSENLKPASRFDTLEFLKFAFMLTPLVSFTQMYLQGHDATIIIRKHELSQ